MYTYYFRMCAYVVKLSYTIAIQDWRQFTGSIPVIAGRTRDVTSDVIWRHNFPPISLTSETATAKNEDQWKGSKIVGRTAKKVWGAQVRDAKFLTEST